jgi:signal transduction histidine kinase
VDVFSQSLTVAAIDMASLDQAQVTLALLPIPAWLYDARGRLRFANQAALLLFDVADDAALVTIIGGTIPEQMARLRPRVASASTIAKATEESIYTFTPDRVRLNSDIPTWASERRRAESAPLRADEWPAARALKKRPAVDLLISLQHPTNMVEIILRASAAPVLEEGRVVGAIMLALDCTAQMLQDGRRDAILSLAGHDIRNPLTPARGLLQQMRMKLAREGDRFAREIDYIDRVLAQLDRIKQIAADLDAVAVNNPNDATESMANVDLVALTNQVAQRVMERHPATPVVVRANAPAMRGVWSGLHLERALVMLVDSAVRRSPPGRAVTVRLKQQRNQFKVEISDQGPPLSPENLEAIRAVLERGGAALALTHGWDLDLSTVQTMLAINHSRLLIGNPGRTGRVIWFALPAPAPDPEL